jgi:predicted PurR-regulated permease PerM
MTIQRQLMFWLIALVVVILMLFLLRGILLPFVAGFALAYLLDPLADRLNAIGLGRLGASLIILILFVLIFIVTLVILVPLGAQQVAACRAMWRGFSSLPSRRAAPGSSGSEGPGPWPRCRPPWAT